MKKIFISILTAVLTLSVTAYAQDPQTVVSEALAKMPAASAADNDAAVKEIAEAAPESVIALASMLQAPEKGANNLVEYAITGVCRYAAAPANRNTYLAKVRTGMEKAVEKCTNPTNKQYLQSELDLMGSAKAYQPEVFGVDAIKEAKALAKSDLQNDNCHSLYLVDKVLADAGEKIYINALKNDNRAVRTTALKYLAKYATDETYAKVVKKSKKLCTEAKEDVLNWLGDNKVASQKDFILSFFSDKELAPAAIEAAGKTGGEGVVKALLDQFGTENAPYAASALKSFKGSIADDVVAAINDASSVKLGELLLLASVKHITGAVPAVMSLAKSSDTKTATAASLALAALATSENVDELGTMLDGSSSAIPALSAAYVRSLSYFAPEVAYAKTSAAIKNAKNPERFYLALARSETDDAVKDLTDAYKAGSQPALLALMAMNNYNTIGTLLEAGATSEPTLVRYVQMVVNGSESLDAKTERLALALKSAPSIGAKTAAIQAFAAAPTFKSFSLVSACLDDKETALAAAGTVTAIIKTCKDDLDADDVRAALNKASAAFSANLGDADISYAIDEINNMLAKLEDPSVVFTLSDEEKKQGFEMLFDGTNLDKFVGNKDNYQVINNNICVVADAEHSGDLYTAKEYKDFVFRFEFSFTRPGANNGIGIRTPMGVDAAYGGMCEVQVLDHDDPVYSWLREYQVHGSVYGVIPAKRIVHKPLGEWGVEEIRVKGNHITVTVNGEVIVDGDIKEACQGHNVAPDGSDNNPYTVDHRNHPGMFNKTGYIGFLGHGPGVRFRNVRVLDLSKKK